MNKKLMFYNFLYAFLAQGISFLLSILMSLIVPKLFGVEEYGYWQLFLFYSGYTTLFHFGITDGMYLRLGGKEYRKLDYALLGTQYKLLIISQIIFGTIIIIVGGIVFGEGNRHFVFFSTALYMLLNNMSNYLGYIFQATNKTKIYSKSIMIDRVSFIILLFILTLFKSNNFKVYILLYLVCRLTSLSYCTYKARNVVFARLCKLDIALREMFINMFVGIKLLLANTTDALILGSGRLFIDYKWGISNFGIFSFSLSLTNFFLQFISQTSMVLFPALRQINEDQQNRFYITTRDTLFVILPIIYLAYLPLKGIVRTWLPQYSESLKYLVLLLPICTYDGKMQLLCNTYYKVLRKENVLFYVNLMAMCLAFAFSAIGVFIIKDMKAIILLLVLTIMFRSVLSEMYLAKLMKTSIIKNLLFEFMITVIYMSSTWYMADFIAFFTTAIFYALYLVMNLDKTKKVFHIILSCNKA